MADYDAVIVGSGINSLAAGAILAKAGWRVCVLERNDYLGGAIKTAELTEPGFHHDVFSAWHPLWVGGAAHAELGDDLSARGLEYLNTDFPTGSLYPDGSSAFLLRSTDANADELESYAAGDGAAWQATAGSFFANADLSFGLLGTELWSPAGARLALKAYRRLGRRGLLEFTGGLLVSCRDWVSDTFASERAHGLLAPWVLHTGLGPDAGLVGIHGAGDRGRDAGGRDAGSPRRRRAACRCAGATHPRLRRRVRDGRRRRARARRQRPRRRRAPRRRLDRHRGPGRDLQRDADAALRPAARRPAGEPVASAGRRYRYGRGEMQIHLALSEPPRWEGDERLGKTAILHVTPGLDGVSRAVNEAERGLLPAEATIVCGQPMTMDESRAPDGKWMHLDPAPGAASARER